MKKKSGPDQGRKKASASKSRDSFTDLKKRAQTCIINILNIDPELTPASSSNGGEAGEGRTYAIALC